MVPPSAGWLRSGRRDLRVAAAAARGVLSGSVIDLVILDVIMLDVMMLDVMMPGEDGLSLWRHIREVLDTPVILLTALAERTDRIVGPEIGADDDVTKPFDPREIGLIQISASVIAVLVVIAIAMRGIVGPVKALARAAERAGRGVAVEPLPERGPRALHAMTAAFDEMQARSRAFVSDRTRMLAAISHDLRTPIASLWLRAEMVEDAGLRDAVVRTISEMREMVEATLAFARDEP